MAKIAVIAGDGIGKGVTREALKVLRSADGRFGLGLEFEELDYGAERYLRDGVALPAGEMDRFRREVDAIFLGALGDPRIPDMQHAKDILLAIRFELELYINLRPVKAFSDRFCPLKDKRKEDIDFVVFRENTEGLYAGMGGIFKKGTPDEIGINECINTRKGVERIIRAAFVHAEKYGNQKVTMVDKSNAMRFAHDIWTRVFAEVGEEYPKITKEHRYVDAIAMELIRSPENFEVIVTSNMFGDIITDLGAELQGGLGMAASGNIHPGRVSLFEPVHGSSPPLAGKNQANPMGAILSGEMMLRHLGHDEAAQALLSGVQAAIQKEVLTPDVGGSATMSEVGDFVAEQISL